MSSECIFLSVSCIWIPFPSSLLSTVECGGCTTLGFLGSPIKFNSPTEVVGTSPEGCDLHETSTERGCAPVPTSLLVVFNITHRGPSIPCTDPELSTTLVDGPTVVPRGCVTRPTSRGSSTHSLANILSTSETAPQVPRAHPSPS